MHTQQDALLDDFDDGYEECSSDSDIDLGDGDDGPIDDDLETHLVHYETLENRRYERADYPFYSDIGDIARQEEGLIDSHNQLSFPVWDPEKGEIAKGIRFSDNNEAQFDIKRYHIRTNQRFRVRNNTTHSWAI